jgi:hypothetical protein
MEKQTWKEGLEKKRRYWELQVKQWKESGLSQKEYCRRNNLRDNQLTYWKKRFIKTSGNPVSFVQLQFAGSMGSGRGFGQGSGIRLNIGDEYQVEVDRGFDPEVLKQVVCVLGEV